MGNKIPSYKITDVAQAVNSECRLEIVGIRPGEKLHEEMITTTDALNTVEFEDYYVILPSALPSWNIQKFIVREHQIRKLGKTLVIIMDMMMNVVIIVLS